MLAGKRRRQFLNLRGLLQLNVQRERMPVEDGRLQQHQRRYGQPSVHDALEVALNTALHGSKRTQRVLAVAIQKVERHLRIKYALGELLEGKQVHGLLMQLVHAALSVFRSRFECCRYGTRNVADLLGAKHEEGQHHRGGMGDGDWVRREIHFRSDAQLMFNPWGPQYHALLILKRIGEINDVAPGVARHLPRIAGEVFIGRKEREVHILQVLGQHPLNKRRLLAYSLQLPQRFVIVEQTEILRRKVAVAKDVLQLPALQRGGAHDGYAEHPTPVSAVGTNPGGVAWPILHQAWDTSSCGGEGRTAGRRKTNESRARTPERMYTSASANSTYWEENQISAITAPITMSQRKFCRWRKLMPFRLKNRQVLTIRKAMAKMNTPQPTESHQICSGLPWTR